MAKNYDDLHLKDLRVLGKELRISGWRKMAKADLVPLRQLDPRQVRQTEGIPAVTANSSAKPAKRGSSDPSERHGKTSQVRSDQRNSGRGGFGQVGTDQKQKIRQSSRCGQSRGRKTGPPFQRKCRPERGQGQKDESETRFEICSGFQTGASRGFGGSGVADDGCSFETPDDGPSPPEF